MIMDETDDKQSTPTLGKHDALAGSDILQTHEQQPSSRKQSPSETVSQLEQPKLITKMDQHSHQHHLPTNSFTFGDDDNEDVIDDDDGGREKTPEHQEEQLMYFMDDHQTHQQQQPNANQYSDQHKHQQQPNRSYPIDYSNPYHQHQIQNQRQSQRQRQYRHHQHYKQQHNHHYHQYYYQHQHHQSQLAEYNNSSLPPRSDNADYHRPPKSTLPQSSATFAGDRSASSFQTRISEEYDDDDQHYPKLNRSNPLGTSASADFLAYRNEQQQQHSYSLRREFGGLGHLENYSNYNVGHNEHNDINDDNDDNDDDDDSYDYEANYKQVIVGICAMEKKAQSKPMKEILKRLEDYFEFIKTQIFDESVILNKPIEEWPLCDCLISFHSKGFPLSKAIEYARLRKPFLLNDLDIQYDIQDRRKVYKILEEADIELPNYAVLDRDSANPEERELIENDDHIEVSKAIFNKPFVEKPISAEDHNICIYYPAHAGGGSQRLFRKIGCRSSVYSNESHVRKTGSYIYEEFMPTDGTDVKVYTAGPDYAHAEARKSPALDGKVERDSDGKEIRYPVILTNKEKLIARKVCLAFKQTICGFDLLRANGHSYVCDVNGFSFVKSSMKYYEDCSKIIGNMILRALAPQLHIPWSIPFQLDDPPIVPTTFGRMMELRCVIAVIRHGDRTPKQKMKLEVKHKRFFELYHKYGNAKLGQAKLKKPQQLQEVLDIARYLLGELPDDKPHLDEVIEPRVKLRQLKSVLEMYGHFSGINRKVQLKYQPHGRPRRSSSEDDSTREPSLVLILKWGGELTPAGRVQAEDLGRCFRRLYPASGDYSGPQGLGLLRLHSTFRHDLKIYASDEGRVQMTAAAFAKGFLALEGELTPILFQMVKSANTNGLLDNDCESSKCQKIVKERLHDIMQKNSPLSSTDMEILNPTGSPSIEAACKFICNPYQACEKVHKLIRELNALIRLKRQDNCYTQEYHLYHGETWDLLQRRWAKLEKDFKFPKTKRFDISKIPDIYDCIKYDLQHNQHTLKFEHAFELHSYAKALADIVIPQEYGLTSQEKLMIGLGTCSPLLRKIQADLLRNSADSGANDDETESVNRLDPKYSHGVSSPDRHVRTRLYFTSESHIHSLVTALQYGGLLDVRRDEQWRRSMEFLSAISELNYLSQIVIMLYEDPTKEPTSNDRFHVEIHFSSGVINRISNHAGQPSIAAVEPQGPGFRPSSSGGPQQQQQHQMVAGLVPLGASSVPKPRYATVSSSAAPTTTTASAVAAAAAAAAAAATKTTTTTTTATPSSAASLGVARYATISASLPIQYKSGMNARACSVADVSLISTAVISGSSPELVAVCPYSPSIRPLETLHNELSLRQFIEFIIRLSSLQATTTGGLCSTNTSQQQHNSNALIASTSSTGPPSSIASTTASNSPSRGGGGAGFGVGGGGANSTSSSSYIMNAAAKELTTAIITATKPDSDTGVASSTSTEQVLPHAIGRLAIQ